MFFSWEFIDSKKHMGHGRNKKTHWIDDLIWFVVQFSKIWDGLTRRKSNFVRKHVGVSFRNIGGVLISSFST
jgi:hypothetical protein